MHFDTLKLVNGTKLCARGDASARANIPNMTAKPEGPKPRPLSFPYLKVENVMLFFARIIATTE